MESLQKCFLCGSSSQSFEFFKKRGGYKLDRCGSCGLIFVNPRDEMGKIFDQYESDHSSPIGYYLKTAPVDSLIFNKRLDWIEKYVKPGRLIDIGCNVGTFMEAARSRGWDVTGVDANKKVFEICRSKNLKVYSNLFDQALVEKMDAKNFDLVCINDVIEHFPNPQESLKLACTLLKPGGVLAVNTPNIASFMAQIFQIKPREHIYYFNLETLKRLVDGTGCELLEIFPAGRRRDFGSLSTGVTLNNSPWLKVCGFIHKSGLSGVANFALEHFFKDEIFSIARKN